jgi:RNA-binding protein NOB1
MILYRKKNYQVNMRGRRYNIPNPTFGRRNNDLIIDQNGLDNAVVRKKMSKAEKYRRKQANLAENAYENGWGFEEVKKQNKRFQKFDVGYGRNNPNDNRFWKKKGGKKKRRKKK